MKSIHFIVLFVVCSEVKIINAQGYFNFKRSNEEKQDVEAEEDPETMWEKSGKFEGDIILTDNRNIDKNAARWAYGIVPYEIAKGKYSAEQIKSIRAAFAQYHKFTCIRFVPRKEVPKKFNTGQYITIDNRDNTCSSFIGRRGPNQIVNLDPNGCIHPGVMIHEFMHALGFYHQQSARERDSYVKIVWDNIKRVNRHNFQKHGDSINLGFKYDYNSVMHYSTKAFSKNGRATIIPLKKNVQIGQRKGFSKMDIAKIQSLYKNECNKRGRLSRNG